MTDAGITPEEIRMRDAEGANRQGDWIAPGVTPADPALPSVLDRVIPFVGATPWQTIGWIAAFAVAVAVRLLRLDDWALGTGEAARAYGAWALFRGQPPVAGDSIPDVGALLLLLHGIGFFLFGTTDVVARLVPALAGIAIVALPLTLRRWVGGPAALGMAALAAISPTLVYASRVVSLRSSSPRWRWRRSPVSFASAKPVSCKAPAARRLPWASSPGPPTPLERAQSLSW